MAAGPGIRCIEMGIVPAAEVWDYYRTDGEVGDSISVAVFRWINTENGNGLKRDRAVDHFRGSVSELEVLYQKAEQLCQELENEPDISKCSNKRVRIKAASAASTSPELLAALSHDIEVKVRINVAKHRNTDYCILENLSKDAEPEVRATVARNPNTNPHVCAALTEDPVGTVVTAAKESQKFIAGQV